MERIFPHFKSDNTPGAASYEPGNEASYNGYLRAMMEDAEDYETSILAGGRSEAQLMFYGLSPSMDFTDVEGPYRGEDPFSTLGEILNKDERETANRSTYVSTDVRDAIMLMLPSLVRLFGATESPVYLVPRTQAEVAVAEQGTDYVNYTFWNDNPGFLILYGAIKDALTVKTGFVKWWSEDNKETRRKKFLNISEEQLQMLQSEEPSAKIVSLGNPVQDQLPPSPSLPSPGPMPMAPTTGGAPQGPMSGASPPPPMPQGPPPNPPTVYEYAIVSYEVSKPLVKVCGVPPEEMRLDRYARSFKESRLVGHERIVPVDELIAQGVDRQLCLDNVQGAMGNTFSVEPQLRNPGRFMGSRIGDGCKYGEWYVKIDGDGDGVPELRYITTIGNNREIISDEDANRIKFALFSCDPISHTIVGDSLADYVMDIQNIKTNMMRATLDSAAESINPKTVINENMVNVDDAMNDDLGAVIRTRGNPSESVMFTQTPFLGQQMLPMVELMNDQLARRTGLTDAAKGLDPKALQSSTEIGVETVINGAQERVELVARVLAETGFKDLFSGLYNEVSENPNVQRTIKIRGTFTPFDTGTFDPSMSVEVNENLGKGSDMSRMLALTMIKQDQLLVYQTFGPGNPMVGIQEMQNTEEDILKLANVRNVQRYFKTPTPQQLQAIQNAPPKPDPAAIMAQAQMEKVRMEAHKALAEQGFDQNKLKTETDFKREDLHARTALELEKLKIESQKAGSEHVAKMGGLASDLMKTQTDKDAADQDAQIKTQQMQNDQMAAQQDAQQKEHDAALKTAQLLAQHKQTMASTDSQHVQAMTQMATDHHQAMTGHAVKGADVVLGALGKEADRTAAAKEGDKDRTLDAAKTAATLDSKAKTTKATLDNKTTIAKMKPKPKAKK